MTTLNLLVTRALHAADFPRTRRIYVMPALSIVFEVPMRIATSKSDSESVITVLPTIARVGAGY